MDTIRSTRFKLSIIVLLSISQVSLTQDLVKVDKSWQPHFEDNMKIKDFKQLERKNLILSPCRIRSLLADQISVSVAHHILTKLNASAIEQSSQNRWPILDADYDPNDVDDEQLAEQFEMNLKLQCDAPEQVSIISLEDISVRDRNESFAVESLKELCEQRFQKMNRRNVMFQISYSSKKINNITSTNPTDIWTSYGNSLNDFQFKEHCQRLLELELSLLNKTKIACHQKRNCLVPPIKGIGSVNQECIELSRYGFVPILKLNYICLPLESRFITRTVQFRDLANSISCPIGKVLYLLRVTLSQKITNDSGVGCNSKNCDMNKQEKPATDVFAEDDSVNSISDVEFSLGLNYESMELLDHLDSRKIDSLSSSEKPDGLLSIFGHQQVNARDRRDSTRSNRCQLNYLVAREIMKNCHSRSKCSISLRGIIKFLHKNHKCLSNVDIISKSFGTIDYLCIESSKLEESPPGAQLFSTDSIPNNTESFMEFKMVNQIDYNPGPDFITELGRFSLERLSSQLLANSGTSHNSLTYHSYYRSFIVLLFCQSINYIVICWWPKL